MDDLSLKTISRRTLNLNAGISVRQDIFGVPDLPGERSLRTRLKFLDAIYRFAPQVRLYPDSPNSMVPALGDRYRPSSVPWFLERVRMRIDIEAGQDDLPILKKGQVNFQSLISQFSHDQHSGSDYKSEFFLQIPNDDDEHLTRAGHLQSAECYVHFRPAPPATIDGYDIQYWFFYPYNGKMLAGGAHEGDWEHVTVRTHDAETIHGLYCSAHYGEGKWYQAAGPANPRGFSLNSEGHPIVYSAKESHASYPTAGIHSRPDLPDDHTSDGGPLWRCWEKLVVVGNRKRILRGQDWLLFSGRWGEVGGGVPISELLIRGDGPYTPPLQKTWDDDDELYTPPERTRLIFFTDNNCSGDPAGETSADPQQVIKLKHRRAWNNDSARSLKMINLPAGTVITVYDSTDGNRNEDYAVIQVKQQVAEKCIPTFERSHEDDFVRVEYHRKASLGGLDGKVSRIEIN